MVNVLPNKGGVSNVLLMDGHAQGMAFPQFDPYATTAPTSNCLWQVGDQTLLSPNYFPGVLID